MLKEPKETELAVDSITPNVEDQKNNLTSISPSQNVHLEESPNRAQEPGWIGKSRNSQPTEHSSTQKSSN